MRHSSLKVVVLFLASALSCASAAMWAVQLSSMGLVKGENDPASTPPSADTPAVVDPAAEKSCSDQIGKVENGVVMNTMPKYDVAKLLEEHGGAAGKLNVTWNREVPELPVASTESLPLADTENTTYWVYDYRRTDFKTFLRLEHGLIRHKGKQDEFVEVRGELYWTPPDFCGKLRHAEYRVDAEGFAADVTLEYCFLNDETLTCATPTYCHTNGTHQYCVG
ncbi:uncharacterized protein LOC117641983 [Thrips palmi]|uniref:Uncharacterized protein LOC117641983 n=1 Tax=Thrips palmi TaxID=161013 RepID=A0A6P8YGD3_THRPL|nr:uncharacterized protein LOC117641983 [Thrips palmi]